MRILILNGPNLNLLGIREPDIYGRQDYAALESYCQEQCRLLGADCTVRQTNHEGVLVDWIQQAMGEYDGIVLNPAAYTHTSVALLDALKAVSIPTVEVHLSDINAREEFRRVSYVRETCIAVCAGEGFASYGRAIGLLVSRLATEDGGLI